MKLIQHIAENEIEAPLFITKMTDKQLLDRRAELTSQIASYKKTLEYLNDELLTRLGDEKSLVLSGYNVTRASRYSFIHVPLEWCKKHQAVKKVPDASVIKPLFEKGIKVPDVSISEYVLVTPHEKIEVKQT